MLPFNIGCGDCSNCSRTYSNACLVANPDAVGAGFGYSGLGPYQGGQAEYIRVPYADYNCLKVPGTPGDKFEDNFILLADIFPTAYHSNELAKVELGSTVAIYGAGPVGMLAALSCQIKGASEIYVKTRSGPATRRCRASCAASTPSASKHTTRATPTWSARTRSSTT